MTDQELLAPGRRDRAPRVLAVLEVPGRLRDPRARRHGLRRVNVENAAYPLGICAEKNGIGTAVTEGYGVGDLEVIAITHSPCGGCRQWLWEFRFDRVVFRNQGNVVTMTPAELLPETFDDL